MEPTPEACGQSVGLWGEILRSTTAVYEGVAMRTRMSEKMLATLCYLREYPTAHVPSLSDAELLDSLRCVVLPRSSVSAVAMLHHLQVADANFKSPNKAFDIHNHALFTWVETQSAIADTTCCTSSRITRTNWATGSLLRASFPTTCSLTSFGRSSFAKAFKTI